MTPCPRRTGFTLLEMSIVIVIIALIVGGLAGIRTYTKNAENTNTMNEAKFFTDAFNKFQYQYSYPPGDFPTASTTWKESAAATSLDGLDDNGDGNGLIRTNGVVGGNKKEWFYSFQHLALAGMIAGKYTGKTASGVVGTDYVPALGTNIPAASAKGVGFAFDHPAATDGIVSTDSEGKYIDGIYPNVIIVAGSPAGNSTIPNQPFLTPKQALQLDEKFDDGLAGTGNITPPINSGTCTNVDTTAAAYLTSSDAKTCYFIVKMSGT